MERTYNLVYSGYDARDHRIVCHILPLPPSVDLRSTCPSIYDQGSIGSCTANATAALFAYTLFRQQGLRFAPSRLFLYYNTRSLEHTTRTDNGATLRSTMSALNKNGVCNESLWPYLSSLLYTTPSSNAYKEGVDYEATRYASLPILLSQMKTALSQKLPFVMGIMVYSSFESKSVSETGMVPIPVPKRETLLGGHAIMVVGYDDSKSAFLVRNSWGVYWGIQGYCWIPYAYLTNPQLAFDAWVLYNGSFPTQTKGYKIYSHS